MMKKILVVDDSKEIRTLVSATLGTDDFEVIEAKDAAEALQVCSEQKPDLIVMDIKMPGSIDGIKATRMIKESHDTAHCQVIILSGIGSNYQIEEALSAGAVGYLKKPFSPLELIEKVEDILAARS
jgi:CheY-like chemotaxis protein